MATRLSMLSSLLSSMAICLTLATCATFEGNSSPDGFCQIAAGRLPIRPSRKDTPETIRQAVTLNSIHKELCHVKADPGSKD